MGCWKFSNLSFWILDFLGPRAGGIELRVAGRDLLVLTPQSPLGRQFLGKRVGETVQMPSRSGTVSGQTILSVA